MTSMRMSQQLILSIVQSRQPEAAAGVDKELMNVIRSYARKYPLEYERIHSVLSDKEVATLFLFAETLGFEGLLSFAFSFPMVD